MKNLIFTETDKFTSKTTIKSLEIKYNPELCIYVYINYRYVSSPEVEELLVDVKTSIYGGGGRINIKDGELIFNINDTKNIQLKAHDNGRQSYSHSDDECVYYVLKKEDLLDICEAQKIEIKLSGAREYMTMTCNELIKTARAMYNAIYDSSMYVEEVQKYEEERQVEIEKAERAATTAEQKKNIATRLFWVGLAGTFISFVLACFGVLHWTIIIIFFIMFIIGLWMN